MERIMNANLRENSLQVSVLEEIPAGNSTSAQPFLVKNITDNDMIIEVLPADGTAYISTVFYPGWNPELIKGIKGVIANTLQKGY